MSNPKHPIQPVYRDDDGRIRFKKNAIVECLLEHGPFDMNRLACRKFSQEDQEQFAQLIGYSLDGFEELSYASVDTCNAARGMANGQDPKDARIEDLQSKLNKVREALIDIVPELFRIHPDDLREEY